MNGPLHAGTRRLSINNLAGGGQPLWNQDRTVALLYNGEIYNSPALRRGLERDGTIFRTQCDGEVIPHLYDRHGAACFAMLDGMFATAVWDTRRQILLLARDPAGEKPLYYTLLSNRELAFASELKGLYQFGGPGFSINRQALWDLPTFLWIPEPDTVFEGVFALPRGHLLISTPDSIEVKDYRKTPSAPKFESDSEAIQEIEKVVRESIESRLLSDAPVGAFLSGGLDSSIVVAIANKKLAPLATFTIGMEDLNNPYGGVIDESPHAEALSRHLGTAHHQVQLDAQSSRRDLSRFVRHGDQPFAVSSALGVLAIARRAREVGIKVLLSGDCADECFGGYTYYQQLQYGAGGEDGGEYDEADVSMNDVGLSVHDRLRRLAAYPPDKRAWAWHYHAAEGTKAQLFSPDLRSGVMSSLRHFSPLRYLDELNTHEPHPEDFVRHDRNFYMPFEMLTKLDRMTMAYSVEGRAPFAASAVLELANRLRFNQMVRNGNPQVGFAPGLCRSASSGGDRTSETWVLRARRPLATQRVVRSLRRGIRSGLRTVAPWLPRPWRPRHWPENGARHRAAQRTHLFSFIILNLWLRECSTWKVSP